ncbi:ESX secretion-associated protein EspG [Rhodococcus kronopolitis]|uniref:ESX secretion-associated protein EspG n=1 Tax=Rhodococcus kronopolitis TaxID=1460226 RepID=A0ABV9FVW2_9NOCA
MTAIWPVRCPGALPPGAVLAPTALPPTTLALDELDLLLQLLDIDELPVVLDAAPRHDAVAAREAAGAAAARTLTGRGLLDGNRPHPDLADRLWTLARPDREVSLRRHTGDGVERLCVARGPRGAMAADRGRDHVVLRHVPSSALGVLCDALGSAQPLAFGPVNTVTAGLVEALADCGDPTATARSLAGLGLAGPEAVVLAAALATCLARTEIVAVRHSDGRAAPLGAPVAVFDTEHGRILGTSSTAADGVGWSTLGPGGDARVRQAVAELLAEPR